MSREPGRSYLLISQVAVGMLTKPHAERPGRAFALIPAFHTEVPWETGGSLEKWIANNRRDVDDGGDDVEDVKYMEGDGT